MAIPFLSSLDLNQNELLNVRFQNLASAPSTPVAGQAWYDSGSGKFVVREGAANVSFATTTHNHDADYAAAGHTHDTRYYTEAEVDSLLSGKSDTGHTHDTFTEAEHDSRDHSTALGTAVLSDLSNVSTSAPGTGNALLWNGTAWAPGDVSSGSHNHDDRYYTESEVDTFLAGKSNTGHAHAASDVTSGTFADARIAQSNVTQHQAALSITQSQISDLDHLTIEEVQDNLGATTALTAGTSLTKVYDDVAGTITLNVNAADFATAAHTHDDRYYTESEVNSLLSGKSDTSHTHTVGGLSDTAITSVADNEVLAYNTATAQWINQTAAEAGLATSGHNHDSTYYTESEVNSLLAGKSDTSHTHDTRYYTETEVDTLLAGKSSTSHHHDADYVELTGDTLTGFLTLHADPTSALHAATKQYVDGIASGLNWKAPVRAATTANITLSGTQTIDGVAVAAGNRVLVKNQTTGSQNGIYVVASGAWTRASDADASAEVNPGMAVFVEEGTANADTGWVLSNDGTVTVGTTALVFVQFTSLGQVTAGDGLTKTGNTLDVGATNASIVVGADGLSVGFDATNPASLTPDIAAAVGSAAVPARRDHVHNVPAAAPTTNLTPSTTNAEGSGASFARNDHTHALTTAAPPASGTGAIDVGDAAAAGTAASFARSDHQHAFAAPGSAPPAVAKTSATGTASTPARSDHTHAGVTKATGTLGDGTATTITVTHNLGTRDVTVTVYRAASPYDVVFCDVEQATTNTTTFKFASAPASGEYRYVITG